MRWRQFLTPVKSLSPEEARAYITKSDAVNATLLDVRQPGEYESGHLPGAKLIPVGELGDRLDEIDPQQPTIVYCAVGGRSRVAAQMLSGKGFKEIYNLSGGIKAYQGEKAVGGETLGLELFSGRESATDTLVAAYALEAGLREFYRFSAVEVADKTAQALFQKLAGIEVKHQDRIFEEYLRVSGETIGREDFESRIVPPAMEGGLTTQEYLSLYKPDLEAPMEIVSLAMAIEAQALDLYQRAAERAVDPPAKSVLLQIASEERSHLDRLGRLIETF